MCAVAISRAMNIYMKSRCTDDTALRPLPFYRSTNHFKIDCVHAAAARVRLVTNETWLQQDSRLGFGDLSFPCSQVWCKFNTYDVIRCKYSYYLRGGADMAFTALQYTYFSLCYRLLLQFQPAAAQDQGCVQYYIEPTGSSRESLWCSAFFSQCDCVSISSSSGELNLPDAEHQLSRVINQAEVFGVSRSCLNSFVSLYCHQIYTLHQEAAVMTNGQGQPRLIPREQQVCTEDCERVITMDCGTENWNTLSNVIEQFIGRGTIRLPALRQLEDCPTLEPGGTGMEQNETLSCIPLEPCTLITNISKNKIIQL